MAASTTCQLPATSPLSIRAWSRSCQSDTRGWLPRDDDHGRALSTPVERREVRRRLPPRDVHARHRLAGQYAIRAFENTATDTRARIYREGLGIDRVEYFHLYVGDTLSLGRTTIDFGARYDRQWGASLPSETRANPPSVDHAGNRVRWLRHALHLERHLATRRVAIVRPRRIAPHDPARQLHPRRPGSSTRRSSATPT